MKPAANRGPGAMIKPVKLFLSRENGKPEATNWGHPDDGEPATQASAPGLRGWLSRRVDHVKERWRNARTGLSGKLHQVWDWLHRRIPPDEPILAKLRKADRIEVFHPRSLAPVEARTLWGEYLADRRRRHLPRFALCTLVSPFTVLLAPLPGPNLVGYWFAYRSIHHLLILYGLRRVRRDEVAISFHPVADPPRASS